MSYTQALATRSPSRSLPFRFREAVRSFVQTFSLKDPALAKYFGRGYESAAGISVTAENAFTFSAVFDAVNQIASDEAKLPLNHMKRLSGGGAEPYATSKLYKLLKYEPNPEMSAMVFRRTLMAHALTCHGGYAEIERDGAERPKALWILTPDRVRPFRERVYDDSVGKYRLGPLVYEIDGGPTTLPAKDVLHIHGLGYDGYCGYSIIDKARQTIALALAAEKFGANYFGKGTIFGGWLESDADLDELQKKEIRENIEAFRAQQDAAFRILVTGAGHKFHQFTNKPSESQMDESRNRQVEEVARFFRMPPYKLGVNTPGTVSYASVEAANLDYYTGCLLDWITLVEQEFNRKLISPLEQGQQFIKHNVNAFLRADTAARSAFYMAMLDRGVFNADMVLELEDLNPQPNGQGQLLLVQGAMIPKDKLVEKIDADIVKTKKEPRQPTPPPAKPDPDMARALAEALARAERSETAAQEAQIAAQVDREARVAAETTGTATAEQLAGLRETEQRSALLSAQTMALSEQLRADLATAQALVREVQVAREAEHEARTTAEAAQAVAEHASAGDATARLAAENEARQAIARALSAEQRAIEAERLATEHDEQRTIADAARAQSDHLHQQALEHQQATETRLIELEARCATLAGERDSVAAGIEAQQLAAVDLERSLTAATQQIDVFRSSIGTNEMAVTALQQAIMALERERDDSRARLEKLTREQQAREADLVEARAAIETIRTDAEGETVRLQAALSAAEATVQAATTGRIAAEVERDARIADLQTQRETETAGAAAVVSAHRALVVDVMRRMVEIETERALRAQATPEKFRHFLATFYEGHEDLCTQRLLPAVRVHLAWIRSTDDAVAVTKRLIRDFIEESVRALTAILEDRADNIPAAVATIVQYWPERSERLADVLMQDELHLIRARPSSGPLRRRKVKFDKNTSGDIIGASIIEDP